MWVCAFVCMCVCAFVCLCVCVRERERERQRETEREREIMLIKFAIGAKDERVQEVRIELFNFLLSKRERKKF